MYDVEYRYGYWWIVKDGEVLTELGHFIDPISPKIIVEEMNGQI